MRHSLSVIAILTASFVFAQDTFDRPTPTPTPEPTRKLVVKDRTYLKLSGAEGMVQIGERIYFDQAPKGISLVPVGIVRVESDAANIEVIATDQNRTPIEVDRISENVYAIEKAGKYWVDITAIDFDKNIYLRKTIIVEVGQGPNPPPGPDPPGPTPPPTPDEIPNEYAVGKIAYGLAQDADTAKAVGLLYQRAADFLYGRPTIKAVDHVDPNKNVLSWLDRETKGLQGWNQPAIRDALRGSQTTRSGYTREDWFRAFTEISNALNIRGTR